MKYAFRIFFSVSLGFLTFSIPSCDFKKLDKANRTYVKPSVNFKGQMRKGQGRINVSTDKNAIKNQNRSRYYYQTRGTICGGDLMYN